MMHHILAVFWKQLAGISKNDENFRRNPPDKRKEGMHK